MYMCAYLCMCASECTYVCIYSYVCLFIYVHLHVFIHVWAHPSAPNHVQVFSSHFRVMWRSFRPGLPFIPSLLLQWSDRTLPHGFSDIRWILVGQPLPTSHLPVCVQQNTEYFFSRVQEACGLAVPGRAGSSLSQYCLLLADGHKKRQKWEGLGARQSEPLKMSKALATSSLVTPCLAGSLAGFLSALLREALLIHPHENGRFIHIDIINEEAGSMLYQLTPQGKVKWAFFWRVVPKLRTVTHSK